MYSRFSLVWLTLLLRLCVSGIAFSVAAVTLVALPVQAKQINQLTANIAAKPKIASTQTIVVFGDSLSAAYGIEPSLGWVTLLQQRLTTQKYNYKVVNASISGETTSGGLSRFGAMLLEHKPNIVVIELGANDGLRGLPVTDMQSNLDKMILLAKPAKLVLIGMQIPPNYGIKYRQDFSDSFKVLAKKHRITLVPFLLDGVAGKPSLTQDDGLHPIAAAQGKLLDNVWPLLKPLLKH